jgi:hypothetical protein
VISAPFITVEFSKTGKKRGSIGDVDKIIKFFKEKGG